MAISKASQARVSKALYYLGIWIPLLIMVITAVIYEPKKSVPVVDHLQVKNTFAERWLAIILILWFLMSYWKKQLILPKNPLAVGLSVLGIVAVLSLFWSTFTGHTLAKLMLWFGPVVLIFLFYQTIQARWQLERIAQGVFIAGVGVALIGCGQYLFDWQLVAQAANPSSTFGNKNMACHMVVLAMPLAFYFLLARQQSVVMDSLYAAGMMVMAAFLFYTTTRSAWGAVFVELILLTGFMLVARKHLVFSKQKLVVIALALVGLGLMVHLNKDFLDPNRETIVSVFNIFTNHAGSALNEGMKGGNIRFTIWDSTFELIKESPLIGYGLGTFFNVYPDSYVFGGHSVRYAHNEFLELAVELGALGLLIVAICMILALAMVLRVLKRGAGRDKVLVFAVLAAIVGTSMNAGYSFVYSHIAPMLLLGCHFFILMALYEHYSQTTPAAQLSGEDQQPMKLGREWLIEGDKKLFLILPVTLLASAVFVLNVYWQRYIDDLNHNIRKGGWDKAIVLPKAEILQLPNFNWVYYGAASGFQNTAPELSKNFSATLYEAYPRHYNNQMILINHYLRDGQPDEALKVTLDTIEVRPIGTLRPYLIALQLLRNQQNELAFSQMMQEVEQVYDKERQIPKYQSLLDGEMNWLRGYIAQHTQEKAQKAPAQ
ncbi:MAG: O-antigen ligase family protein [Pseudomonadota bacterium]|nr:O-antigen ligase family protein [Pseudomonadota bacterium]